MVYFEAEAGARVPGGSLAGNAGDEDDDEAAAVDACRTPLASAGAAAAAEVLPVLLPFRTDCIRKRREASSSGTQPDPSPKGGF